MLKEGCKIKLKLGKEETGGSSKVADINSNNSGVPNENKQDLESIRTVIKVDETDSNSEDKKTEESPQKENIKDDSNKNQDPIKKEKTPTLDYQSDETRDIIHNMKDFDLQIKKNQEEIGKLFEKLDGLSNDLDDLVSLYEIVSEQMNPFVGLSKVTKKRIDALENFTQEVDSLKSRIGDIESIIEKNLSNIGDLKELQKIK